MKSQWYSTSSAARTEQREGVAGAPALQIFPEAPLAFFWKAVDAQIQFTTDANGAVTGAALSQGGQLLTGKRITP